MIDTLLPLAIRTAKEAGKTILKYYQKDRVINQKDDNSPLTLADQASHSVICKFLSRTNIQVVSEEGDDLLIDLVNYWLVDPLDGTKDYLAANDEFTVNIALIKNGKPVLGVIWAPALSEFYAGINGTSAWQERQGKRTMLQEKEKNLTNRMAVSRFHNHPDTKIFAQTNRILECIPIGSALKYGRLAMGEFDVYPRLVGSSEWDTAAGQAVLEASGGSLLDWHTGKPLVYGKPNRRNGRLLAFRAAYKRADFKLKTYKSGLL